MTKNDELKTKINKVTLFVMILSLFINFIQGMSSPIFKNYFKGKLEENVIKPSFPEKYRNNSCYLTLFKYKHTSGDPIHKVTLIYTVNNTGATIDFYEPYFKTLFNKALIRQEKDKNYVKIEIDEIRPGDEFDVRLYSKNLSDINSSVTLEDGYCTNAESESYIRKPVLWISVLIVAFFVFFFINCRRTIKILEAEKHRVIGERDALQNLHLEGMKKSSRSNEG